MYVLSTYEGPSLIKLNERALDIMNSQEDTSDERYMFMRENFPDIKAGDWVGVNGYWGETHYGIVKNIYSDTRPGWENSAEEYHIHLIYNNQDIVCLPTELVSHAPMHMLIKLNNEIKRIKLYKEIQQKKIHKDMINITNKFITSITNRDINWK